MNEPSSSLAAANASANVDDVCAPPLKTLENVEIKTLRKKETINSSESLKKLKTGVSLKAAKNN